HDLLAEPPAVEPARAAPGQLAVGAGEVRVAEDRADGGDLPVREEQLAGRDDVAEPVRVQRGLVVELPVHDEPALGDPYGRAEQRAEVAAAEAAQGELPLRERAGHADSEPAGDGLVERERLTGRGVDEGVPPHPLRRGLPAVEGVDAALP